MRTPAHHTFDSTTGRREWVSLQQSMARALWLSVFFALGLLVFAPQNLEAQLRVSRSVVACGAAQMSDGTFTLNGTLGQVAVGRVADAQKKHSAGFWYTIQMGIDSERYAALVVLPNTHAAPGEIFSQPLILQQSKSIMQSGARSFKALLRFNATLMEPVNKVGYNRSQDTGFVEVSGSVQDSAQVLASIDFLAKLGNNEKTDVEIVSFQFIEASSVSTIRKNGVFSLDGVCRENGEIRLVRSVEPTTLRMVPNPVSDNAEIRVYVSEYGWTEISIIDERGVTISSILSEDLKPGSLTLPIHVKNVPSGSYFLLMRTPNELFTQKFIIQK